MAAKPPVGFLDCARMRARPAGPAESSALHYFARRGPTKEAHRRALNRSGGLQRPDQRKRPEAGSNRYAVACVPIMVGIAVPIMVGTMVVIVVSNRVPSDIQENARLCTTGGLNYRQRLQAVVMVRGPRSASARPGPCTRPRSADALTRREIPPGPTDARRQARSSSPRRRRLGRPGDGRRGLQLDPGSGRMVPMTRVGRSARRAASPPGEGAAAPADQRR
jgi:hypothetical protein